MTLSNGSYALCKAVKQLSRMAIAAFSTATPFSPSRGAADLAVIAMKTGGTSLLMHLPLEKEGTHAVNSLLSAFSPDKNSHDLIAERPLVCSLIPENCGDCFSVTACPDG